MYLKSSHDTPSASSTVDIESVVTLVSIIYTIVIILVSSFRPPIVICNSSNFDLPPL